MAETGGNGEILQDAHFQVLASSKIEQKEFNRLLQAHLPGYTQKKRVVEGLKEFLVSVEAVEQKLYFVKNLGSAKGKLEVEDQRLLDSHSTIDLKEKIQVLNTDLQAMIDEGRLTSEEKPVVHDNLIARRQAAKEAEKPKLLEKLERMLVCVSKAEPIVLPLAGLEAIYPCQAGLQAIHRIEKRPEKSWTEYDRELLSTKAKLQEASRALEPKSRMWFESDREFQPRLEKAVAQLAKQKLEQKKREEEEELERKRLESEQALERKRLAHHQAEEQRARELEEKLELKRLEAKLKPQKEAPQAKKKEKVLRTKMDAHDFYAPPPRVDSDDEESGSAQPSETVSAAATPLPSPSPSPALVASKDPKTSPSPMLTAAKDPAPKASPKKAPAKVIESKWASSPSMMPALPEELAAELAGGDLPSLAEAVGLAGPTLADAVKAAPVKKAPPPQPVKKEKKKFAKMDLSQLGFDANNPNNVA
eukprot:CAMPEP_0115079150 /NCGR_PEP_ID=MMETSP0227-20121206/17941_1 /TAXON_ID=89957 /ORGANISM="Polarella glacialis, Strain CCMP 1383" /LENGTH=475 /DNA_ID=CAMNT_0002466607 /DNA_START=86 /DNA_END=1513 /DNA_ORIENTATION=-